MISRVVVDASPLIILIKSDLADILPQIFTSVLVPGRVYDEILAGDHNDKARQALPELLWVDRVEQVEIVDAVEYYDLGQGEAETLSFALSSSETVALIDDAAARKCAQKLSIPFLGTGGLLVLAKHRGIIRSFRDALVAVRDSGLWISHDIAELLLSKADE